MVFGKEDHPAIYPAGFRVQIPNDVVPLNPVFTETHQDLPFELNLLPLSVEERPIRLNGAIYGSHPDIFLRFVDLLFIIVNDLTGINRPGVLFGADEGFSAQTGF